ncbi:O-antigen ligase like membrane family protein [Francisella philomiragia subsp. philomiragia ATCC 25015]|uniref:membrane protein n=2 Tax=Francisella philomiragia TaxID=28110 RepID=UPI0005A57F0B|nr:membrane protein [Francisella philomiragia]AJI74942.1 O-antigen ligase like membrane family protein [Francisella philomiragia subsp. philomiragia ATCC 25015]MBK2238845.1 hypothetical protein [Francisella philomiragia]
MRSEIYTKIVFVLMLVMFVSIFFFARFFISVGFILIIFFSFFNKEVFKVLKNNKSLQFLLLSAIMINIGMIYASFASGSLDVKSILGFSNPIFIFLYICSASYFLSKNTKYANYLLNFYIAIIVIFSLYALFRYVLHANFVVSQIYFGIYGGSVIQSIVALTFPFSAVVIIGKAIRMSNLLLKILMFAAGLLVIFIDLFVNRSKAGYVIEFVVFIYYSFIALKYFSFKNNKLCIKRLVTILTCCIVIISIIFGTVYKFSSVFNYRLQTSVEESQVFFNQDYDNTDARKQYETSTGLRLLYYSSSFKVLREYPKLYILGCPYLTSTTDVIECTKVLINKNQRLRDDPRVVNDGIMAHDEFINYVFRAGIVAGVSLLLCFVAFFVEARWLDYRNRVYFRILILAMFIGCLFDYFFTTQIMVILFANLTAIFLAQRKCEESKDSNTITS